jgi:hypothetical protein
MTNTNSTQGYGMQTYTLREDSGAEKTVLAKSLEDACAQAREWVEGGEYDAEETASKFETSCYIFAGVPTPGTAYDASVTVRFRVVDGVVEVA